MTLAVYESIYTHCVPVRMCVLAHERGYTNMYEEYVNVILANLRLQRNGCRSD